MVLVINEISFRLNRWKLHGFKFVYHQNANFHLFLSPLPSLLLLVLPLLPNSVSSPPSNHVITVILIFGERGGGRSEKRTALHLLCRAAAARRSCFNYRWHFAEGGGQRASDAAHLMRGVSGDFKAHTPSELVFPRY